VKVPVGLRATQLACLSSAPTAWSKAAASGTIFQLSYMILPPQRRALAQTQVVAVQGLAFQLGVHRQMQI
jgi:hypothetical protein